MLEGGPPLDDANIHAAVVKGDVDSVDALLRAKPERAWQVNVVGNAPLHLAATTGSVEIARLLIGHGAPIDAPNGDLRTPAVVALTPLPASGRLASPRGIALMWTPNLQGKAQVAA